MKSHTPYFSESCPLPMGVEKRTIVEHMNCMKIKNRHVQWGDNHCVSRETPKVMVVLISIMSFITRMNRLTKFVNTGQKETKPCAISTVHPYDHGCKHALSSPLTCALGSVNLCNHGCKPVRSPLITCMFHTACMHARPCEPVRLAM